MKYSIILTALAALSTSQLVKAVPTKRATPSDVEILNYALSLEHLESNFYQTLGTPESFSNAGFQPFVRNRFVQISQHETTHVEALTTTLEQIGATPFQACTYKFPCEAGDVHCWINLSEALESVGTSAYAGGVASITSNTFRTFAGMIMGVEARHSASINQGPIAKNPWSGAYETPLSPRKVLTITQPFIVSCPNSNDGLLSFEPFPSLSIPAGAMPGDVVPLSFEPPSPCGNVWAAFVGAEKTEYVEVVDDKVEIPMDLKGLVYAIITRDNTSVDDENVVAGPAVLMFNFNSFGVLSPSRQT